MCQKKKKYANSKSIENENEKCTNESTSIRYHTFLHRLQPQSYTNNFAPLGVTSITVCNIKGILQLILDRYRMGHKRHIDIGKYEELIIWTVC